MTTDQIFFALPFVITFVLAAWRWVFGTKKAKSKTVQVHPVSAGDKTIGASSSTRRMAEHHDTSPGSGDRLRKSGESGFRPGGALMLAVRALWRGAQSIFTKPKWPPPHPSVKELVFPAELVRTCENVEVRGQAPISLPIKLMFKFLSVLLDVLYSYRRPLPRFWFLETVARMPYFAYNSALHLYETLGWWRTPQLRTLHFAEENNELHHLLIMEELGGNRSLVDRLLVQPVAVLYYWLLVVTFFFSPSHAYQFCRLVETHAAATYNAFCIANRQILKKIPAPNVARQYYLCTGTEDRFLFDRFHVNDHQKARSTKCDNLLDTFVNIRDDEREHVQAMGACESWSGGDESYDGPPV